ncbi:DUF3772 domain-containing protein [Sagittula sp.]|uniref:DUF3772 domain-containing protein n=1 Tax=Sagittula sp. TaxID=2038081 RepID=UPI004059FEED
MKHLTRALSRVLIAGLLCLAMIAGEVSAQDVAQPDYTEWDLRARADEVKLDLGTAAVSELETMRARIADWRSQFLAAQSTNEARIATVRAQIDSLGPAPEDGASEPDDIAARREALNDQLAELRAPVLQAEEAYTRADGIIAQIDGIIRDRQAREVLALGPSPLNPANWAKAATDLLDSWQGAWQEIKDNVTSPSYQAEARRNLPLVLLLMVVGVMLIARGKRWALMGVEQVRGKARRGTGVFRFLISLGQILLPYLGIYAIVEAIEATGFSGTRWEFLLGELQYWAALMLGTRWLADQTFHEDSDRATIPLKDNPRWEARRLANALAFVYVFAEMVVALGDLDSYSAESAAVVKFPVLVIASLALFRLGRIISLDGNAEMAENEDRTAFRLRFQRLLGRMAMVVAVVGTFMAAIGYFRFGEVMVYPYIATLALVFIVLLLQRFIFDLSELINGTPQSDGDGLIPVLAGFLLSAAALPFLALIWGARSADLSEIWTRFREGFVFGETRISPTDFLMVIIVFVAGFMLTRLLQGALKSSVLPKTKIDKGGQTAITSGVGYIGIFLAGVVAITAGGLDLSSLAIVAGALSVGIGFGLQTIVSNFVSGIILLVERPISEGDWIEVNGTHGIVKDISVRSTRIETFDKFDLIVPNADLISGTVSNYTRGNSLGRLIVSVGVAYGTDTRKVEKILLDIARRHDMVLMNPEPFINFAGFGADSLDFEIRVILRDVGQVLVVGTDMRHQIMEAFKEAGIEVPFAQRDIWLRNPEVLTGVGRQKPEDPPQEAPSIPEQKGGPGTAAGAEPPGNDGEASGDTGEGDR